MSGAPRVLGQLVDTETRCVHYHAAFDVVAIRFWCCNDWYPCIHCHAQAVTHAVQPWPRDSFATHAVLCGACATTIPIDQYLLATACPSCAHAFNPGCSLHAHLYFDVGAKALRE